MGEIPVTIDDVTSDWLASVTGLPITGVEIEQIGQGIGVSSAVYRVACRGEDCPASLVVKLPALDENAVFTSSVLRMYIREVRFFEQLAAEAPIRVPAGLFGAVDEETSQFVLVMEDLGALRVVDQNQGMDVVDARQCVDELATWHATWWGIADPFVTSGAAVSLADPIYPAVLPLVFGEGWAKLEEELGDIAEPIRRVAPTWSERMPGLLSSLAAAPATIIHGDYRGDNILFADDGSVALLDFQLTGVGSAAYDLAYFVTQSLDPATAGRHERDLFDRYLQALVAADVPESETAGLWEDYRRAALFCLVYPVVASRGMDLSDPRQRALVDNMLAGFARAVDDLSLADLG